LTHSESDCYAYFNCFLLLRGVQFKSQRTICEQLIQLLPVNAPFYGTNFPPSHLPVLHLQSLRYDTIEEFNVDSTARVFSLIYHM